MYMILYIYKKKKNVPIPLPNLFEPNINILRSDVFFMYLFKLLEVYLYGFFSNISKKLI